MRAERGLRTLRGKLKRIQVLQALEYLYGWVTASHLITPSVNSSARPGDAPRFFLCAVVRVKDEGRFLPEWILHHRLAGVEHFYVYDNDSEVPARNSLHPLIDAGLVTVIDWPGRPISPGADVHFLETHGWESQWVAFLDADEFVMGSDLRPGYLARALHDFNGPALALNWRYYGSSRHESVPPGLVLASFEWSDEHFDDHVKTIVRPDRVRAYRNPHNQYYHRLEFARDVLGSRVFGSFSRASRRDDIGLWINHYVYRSREDYSRKVSRGFATSQGGKDAARRSDRIDLEFDRHNECQRPIGTAHLDALVDALKAVGFER